MFSNSMFPTSGLDSIALAAAQLEDEKVHESKNVIYHVSELKNSSFSIPTKSSQTELKMNNDEPIIINRNDVLCGRGGETNHHPGTSKIKSVNILVFLCIKQSLITLNFVFFCCIVK